MAKPIPNNTPVRTIAPVVTVWGDIPIGSRGVIIEARAGGAAMSFDGTIPDPEFYYYVTQFDMPFPPPEKVFCMVHQDDLEILPVGKSPFEGMEVNADNIHVTVIELPEKTVHLSIHDLEIVPPGTRDLLHELTILMPFDAELDGTLVEIPLRPGPDGTDLLCVDDKVHQVMQKLRQIVRHLGYEE